MPELHEPDRSARSRPFPPPLSGQFPPPLSGQFPPARSGQFPPARSGQFDDELVGLDPDDPEAQAFAAHLDHMQRERPAFTVEGYLDGVRDFAESANRAEGGRRWAAVLIVALLLLVAGYIVWEAFMFVVTTWL